MDVQKDAQAIQEGSQTFITDAPEDYDGFGTTTLEWLDYTCKGKQVRRVKIPPAALANEWQLMRYGSGMHFAISEGELQNFIDRGILKPIELEISTPAAEAEV